MGLIGRIDQSDSPDGLLNYGANLGNLWDMKKLMRNGFTEVCRGFTLILPFAGKC